MQAIERIIITHFLESARKAGFIPDHVDDGGEVHGCKTDAEVLEVVDSVDECQIFFKRAEGTGKRETLCIVLGNGEDCLSDMSAGRDDWDTLVASETAWAREPDVILSEAFDAMRDEVEASRNMLAKSLALLNRALPFVRSGSFDRRFAKEIAAYLTPVTSVTTVHPKA